MSTLLLNPLIERKKLILAILIPILAVFLQDLLWPMLSPMPLILLYPAVFLSAWIGGLVGGLIATALVTVIGYYYFLPPYAAWADQDSRFVYVSIIFVMMGITISLLFERLHRTTAELRRINSLELERNQKRLKQTLLVSKTGLWEWNLQTNVSEWSENLWQLYGLNPQIYPATHKSWLATIHPNDRKSIELTLNLAIENHTELNIEWPLAHPINGQERWLMLRGQPEFNPQGDIELYRGIVMDITERKQAEQERRIAAIAFESQEGMVITDDKCNIIRVNAAFTAITGYTPDEVIGKNPSILKSGRQDAQFYASMWQSINNNDVWEGEIWNRRKNGEIYPQHLTITAVKAPNGKVTNYVSTFADITLSKASEEIIQNLAFYDPLTSLPNRRLIMDRLNNALVSCVCTGKNGAVLIIDLDNFKNLNDTHGHAQGDLLLQQVAQRLTSCVREGDTVARLGGDEFVVILEDLNEDPSQAAIEAEEIGHNVLAKLNHTYQLDGHVYQNTPSIGITLFYKPMQCINDLLKEADIAMYQAKKAGRNTLRFFTKDMAASIVARTELEKELLFALESRQFQLYYQIQVNDRRQPLGAEVLIRWIHPVRGLVSPTEFIPLAEETGLIIPIGLWVLETACEQLKAWQLDEFTQQLKLSVNVSSKQFYQAEFVNQVESAIHRHAINPDRLKLELTESMLIEDIEDTIETMNKLGVIGIQFSLDDFGTGYSSLQYLKRLPLYQLKIDQSFVQDITEDNSDQEIVRTIISMSRGLNLNVIAEGVETEEQRIFLEQHGCLSYQGYLFSKPLPIEQFEGLLQRGFAHSSR